MSLSRHTTKDGSITLRDDTLGVHYRSIHGAKAEVHHVFIQGTRLLELEHDTLTVLELGFGAATTFSELANLMAETRPDQRLVYHTIEHHPVPAVLLDHLEGPGGELAREALEQAADWQRDAPRTITLTRGMITLSLHLGARDQLSLPDTLRADAVFHDPFGPGPNPEEWTSDAFAWEAAHMKPQAILSTYGSSSSARAAMCRAGLAVASTPGPHYKREITLASLSPERLAALPGVRLIPASRYL